MITAIILSSQRINNELASEFGDILPIELPLMNRLLLEHQVNTLRNHTDDIYVTLPEGYRLDYHGVKEIEMKDGAPLLEVLHEISQKFTNRHLIIYYGDTLVEFDYFQNVFYTSNATHDYKSWYYTKNNDVFIGLLSIDIELLKSLISRSNDLTNFLSLVEDTLRSESVVDWFDLGNYCSFYYTRKKFLESRSFNEMSIVENNFLQKSSRDTAKMFYEYEWLRKYSNLFPGICPTPVHFNICKGYGLYKVEYYSLPTLSDLFVFGRKSRMFWKKVIGLISHTRESIASSDVTIKSQDNFYLLKFEERIKNWPSSETLVDIEYFEEQRRVAEMLDKMDNTLVPSHGDLCFSNVLLDSRSFSLKLIDPRGYLDRKNGASSRMPKFYDVFKVAHSYVGGYDYIIAGKTIPIDLESNLDDVEAIFGVERRTLLMGMSHLFFTMIPLHDNNYQRQIKFYELSKQFLADIAFSR